MSKPESYIWVRGFFAGVERVTYMYPSGEWYKKETPDSWHPIHSVSYYINLLEELKR